MSTASTAGTAIVLGLAAGASPDTVADVATIAHDTGVSAVRLLDGAPGDVLDPVTTAAHLAGRFPDLRWLVDAPTTHNAPYNLARRVLSLDRATNGRSGLVLRSGDGDEVSEATVPDPAATARTLRWAEYARVLTGLWETFPAAALLGDQETGVFTEDTLIRPLGHEGRFYRVAGPLDGPSSPQGRPVLVADAGDELDLADALAHADVVILPEEHDEQTATRLTEAFGRAGRPREEVRVLGRVGFPASGDSPERVAAYLAERAELYGLDGLDLTITGAPGRLRAVLEALVPRLQPPAGPTLRAALGLPVPVPASVPSSAPASVSVGAAS
ncbi:LLM class flavin-dependent oxidoreductase [Streptomyces sp. NPDC056486]|uniref:LLM class flavin-dependent oxidoreductase n=1 Tax=Streptomyces sp. NPDC056486 TaxID=3345835 RepID=UPI0036ADBA47